MANEHHTKEPWVYGLAHPAKGEEQFRVFDANGYNVLAKVGGVPNTREEMEANAKRIVNCVNALEGMNPEEIPQLIEKIKLLLDGPKFQKEFPNSYYVLQSHIDKLEAK